MIKYKSSADGITLVMLSGFFMGWARPLSAEQHLRVLKNSAHVVLAIDTERDRVVGFVTALSDHIQASFISMLEVLPDYRDHGIGRQLMNKILAALENMPATDLMCSEKNQSFYSRFGMTRSVGMVVRR